MRAESVWRRQGYTLAPWSAEARDALLALSEGGECIGKIWVAQRPEQLRQFFALCRVAAKGYGMLPDRMADLIKLPLGMWQPYFDTMGCIQFEFASLSPQNMDRVDFKAFMARAVPAMAEMIGVAPKDVLQEWHEACRWAA